MKWIERRMPAIVLALILAVSGCANEAATASEGEFRAPQPTATLQMPIEARLAYSSNAPVDHREIELSTADLQAALAALPRRVHGVGLYGPGATAAIYLVHFTPQCTKANVTALWSWSPTPYTRFGARDVAEMVRPWVMSAAFQVAAIGFHCPQNYLQMVGLGADGHLAVISRNLYNVNQVVEYRAD